MTADSHEPTEQWEEWRVTGDPGGGFGEYSFVWSVPLGDEEPETRARAFMRQIEGRERWQDGPHLQRRTVIVTDWIPA